MSHFPDRPTRRRIPEQAPEETDEQAASEPVAGHDTATVVPFPIRKPGPVSTAEIPVSQVETGRFPLSKDEAKEDLLERIAQYGTIPTQTDLVHAWGVTKGTVSKWLADFEPEIKRADRAKPFRPRPIRKGDRRVAA